ncbi:MAG TPA: tail fiber protein [Bryobacteraceae bacterium]|nr:tail fiber protein [Bryobacteraceae bacterium]
MADPFVAEIRLFGFNFAPFGWASCAGQLLPISQNTALFSLLGTTYGGNGTSNFALPDLQGRVPLSAGQGPGLSLIDLGEEAGVETVTLLQTQMAAHNHAANCTNNVGTSYDPTGNVWCQDAAGNPEYGSGGVNGSMSPGSLTATGGGQPHNNVQPFLAINYCIALQGVYPARS